MLEQPRKCEADLIFNAPEAQIFVCPEFKEQVRDGVVFLRASCERAVCVRWRSGQCRMCDSKGQGKQQLDLLERRS